jgi:hypothetical protein
VAVAVAGEFVVVVDDASHHLRIAFGNPAEGEEGRLGIGLIEQPEDHVDVALDPARQAVPVFAPNVRSKRRDLEIVLNVDRHRIFIPAIYAALVPFQWQPVFQRMRVRCRAAIPVRGNAPGLSSSSNAH